MGISFIRNKMSDFLFQCISLGTPFARVVTFIIGISVLTCLDLNSLNLPDFCIWEMLFAYCPADGSTRALNAFFHGRWEDAISYNLNILVVIPVMAGILAMDMLKLIKTSKLFKNARSSR